MKRAIPLISALSLLALAPGCAHSGAAQPPSGETADSTSGESAATTAPSGQYSFQSGEGAFTVQVTPKGLSGPTTQVSGVANGYRGTLDGQTVDLSWSENTVHGQLSNQPVHLELSPEGDGTRVRGSWGGSLSNVVLDSKGLEGRMGRCEYSLTRASGDTFTGQSTCRGASPSNTTVTLPAGLAPPLTAQGAAVLAMLLGQ
jgi:hypothetical protein